MIKKDEKVSTTDINTDDDTNQHQWSHKMTATAGVIILLLVVAGLFYWSKQNANIPTPGGVINYPVNNTEAPEGPTILTEGSYFPVPMVDDIDLMQNPTPNTAAQWKTPTIIGDLKLVNYVNPPTSDLSTDNKIVYYDMGTHGTNSIVMAEAPAVDPSGPAHYFFEKSTKGYTFIQLPSNQNIYHNAENAGDYALTKNVTSVDQKTYYTGIIGPAKFSWKGLTLQSFGGGAEGFFNTYLAEKQDVKVFSSKKVDSIKEGELYLFQQVENADGTDAQKFYLRRYVLKLPSGFYTNYNINYAFFSDTQVPQITWNDGSKNKDQYRPDGSGGCGNPGAYITTAKDLTSDLKPAGTTSTKETVYEFTDINNATLKYYYNQQSGSYYNQDKQEIESISISDWYKHHPVIAYKNAVGDFVLMTNTVYGAAAECGKPVIYLYPTKPITVSVKVGASITKSEPAYNNGWRVLARPNGLLTTANGEIYDSLFWEGLGHGDYPAVTEGTVVKYSQVAQVISDQLSELGLNQKESDDFKSFWLSKIPKTPYVRLTWFTTLQLNKLAPLVINPKPDTLIRVFLDFQGLDTPINIPAQHLNTIPRNGFTVIEWGGLLRQ